MPAYRVIPSFHLGFPSIFYMAITRYTKAPLPTPKIIFGRFIGKWQWPETVRGLFIIVMTKIRAFTWNDL